MTRKAKPRENNMIKIKEEVAKPRRVALYASLDSSWCYVSEVDYIRHDEHYQALPDGQERERPKKGFVRVSEPLLIELRQLTDDTIVQKAIESLDEAERQAISELNEKIAAIRGQKAQLLALTHQPDEANV